jgi:hypothetical protein
LDAGYFLDDGTASSTGSMTAAHLAGQQAWTKCHDVRGNEHEYKLTSAEYDALKIRGMPQESIMESPEDAALDSFPVEATSSEPATTEETVAPATTTSDASVGTADSVSPASATDTPSADDTAQSNSATSVQDSASSTSQPSD